MKYYNSSKVNNIVKDLLLEDGGVLAVSPERRGNVGRPLPTDAPTVSGGPLRTVGSVSRAVSQPVSSKPSVQTKSASSAYIDAVTNPYTSEEELLNALKNQYPAIAATFINPEEKNKFIKPYQPGMFAPETAPATAQETGSLKVVDPNKPTETRAITTTNLERLPDEARSVSVITDPTKSDWWTQRDPKSRPGYVEGQSNKFGTLVKDELKFNPIKSGAKIIGMGGEITGTALENPFTKGIGIAAMIGAPVVAGHLAKDYVAEPLLDKLRQTYGEEGFLKKPEYDPSKPAFENEIVNPSQMTTSAVDWGTMELVGQGLARMAGLVSPAEMALGVGQGVLGGALAPVVANLGYETGKLVGEKSGYHPNLEIAELDKIQKAAEKSERDSRLLPGERPTGEQAKQNLEKLRKLSVLERIATEQGYPSITGLSPEEISQLDNFPAGRYARERNELAKQLYGTRQAKSEQEEMERQKRLNDLQMQRSEKAKQAAENTKKYEDISRMSDDEFKKYYDEQMKKLTF